MERWAPVVVVGGWKDVLSCFDKTSRNKFITGCESMRMENVRSHRASNVHKTSHWAFLNSKKRPAEKPVVKALINNHNTDLMKKLFTTAFFVAKNEKPYTDFVKLIELQAANYGDE